MSEDKKVSQDWKSTPAVKKYKAILRKRLIVQKLLDSMTKAEESSKSKPRS